MQRVLANGINIAYTESGSGEPVVLVHGGNADRTGYDSFRAALGDGVRAIAYDQRDSPDTPYDKDGYTLRDHADDCAAFIEALGLERAHVVGASYGGIVAMLTAILYPERVQSLVLMSTSPSAELTEARGREAMESKNAEQIQRLMLGVLLSDEAIENNPELVATATVAVRQRTPEAVTRRMAAVVGHDCRAELASIKAPTLVLHGKDDPVVGPAAATFMAANIPNAELRLIEGRHGIVLEHRQHVAELVRTFVLSHVD
jgi:pimeloyl-ACP methyl ester carboxylesterase